MRKSDRAWSEYEKQFVIDNYNKMSFLEIGEAIGRSEHAVCRKSYLLGLKKGRFKCKDNEEYLYKYAHLTNKELAKTLGVKEQSLRSYRSKHIGTIIDSNYDSLTTAEAGRLVGRPRSSINKLWIQQYGLESKKVGVYRFIKISDLLKWMKTHPDKWDATKCDKSFFMEYEWFRAKREKDFQNLIQKRWGSNAV